MRGRHKFNFPILDPRDIADHVEGHCRAYVSKTYGKGKRWRIEFQIQLKLSKQVKDHDLDTVKLRRGLWLGFEGENAFSGWHLTRAGITESTLTLAAYYRPGDTKRLQSERKIVIAHFTKSQTVTPTTIEVRDLKFFEPAGQ